MPGAFERLAQSVLRHLGQDAFLLSGADTTPTRANIEHAVALAGPYDDGAFPRDVATLSAALGAKLGDRLRIGSDTYTLDGVVATNGYLHRFTVIKAA